MVLKQKENSLQALNRALPLAWLLKQDQSGLKLAEQIPTLPTDNQAKDLMTAAFLTRMGKSQNSKNILQKIIDTKGNLASSLVRGLNLLNDLQINNNIGNVPVARENCKQADAISCWLLFQFTQWENFPKVMAREQKAFEIAPWKNLDQLLSEEPTSKIREEVFIQQRRLNEMELDAFHLTNDLAPYQREELISP